MMAGEATREANAVMTVFCIYVSLLYANKQISLQKSLLKIKNHGQKSFFTSLLLLHAVKSWAPGFALVTSCHSTLYVMRKLYLRQ